MLSPVVPGSSGRMRGAAAALALAVAALLAAGAAVAAPRPLGKTAKRGLELARTGDCLAAVPELERAEAEEHRPATAAALGGCHVALGEIVLAHEIYGALAAEKPAAWWDAADKAAAAKAAQAASELDARIPRVTLAIEPADAPVEVTVAGAKAREPRAELRVPPDEKVEIVVRAEGYEEATLSVLVGEGERKRLEVRLARSAGEEPPKPEPVAPPPPRDALPGHWLGARFRGLLVPTFFMNIFADGGTTTYLPGAGVTYTARLGVVDLEPSLTFTSYNLGPTAFKPKDTPDTEWEIVESDLWGVVAALDVLYRVPISPAVELRVGAGFGIGWAFAGDLYRWQSYPESGQAGDPSSYLKCNGPNDPAGTFRYCNQLDKDADRYGAPDASWGDGGARPIVYPWLAIPQLGLALRPIPEVAIDLELGLTLNGLLTGTGVRFGL